MWRLTCAVGKKKEKKEKQQYKSYKNMDNLWLIRKKEDRHLWHQKMLIS